MRLINRHPDRGGRLLLILLPFALLLFAYFTGSAARLAENPNDKLLPGAAQMVEGAAAGNGQDPCQGLATGRVVAQGLAPDLEENILGDLLRRCRVAQDAHEVAREYSPNRTHQTPRFVSSARSCSVRVYPQP